MVILTIGLQPLHFGCSNTMDINDVRIINGGRKKWLLEDRPITKDIPNHT